ncbi:MAG TPA: dihydrolipoamide acetyltransferase family protein [Kofleriaceae bacterium]|nr:dihydrolipoamide acetyltransferase family protein [Kofleriaceae bacterium]
MAFDFHLPDIGEGVVEGEIVQWKVAEGDVVKLDQPMVEVMTDKATVEIPSPRAGRIAKINYPAGQICPVGKVLVVIDDGGAGVSKSANGNGHGHHAAPAAVHAAPAGAAAAQPKAPETAQTLPITVIDATAGRQRALATPATRRLARQMGVELAHVAPTGKRGRITSEDVKRTAAGGPAPGGAESHAMVPAKAYAPAFAPLAIAKGGDEERIPLRGMRKRIAETMTRSVHTAAHFTYVEEVDMTELVTVRDRARSRAADRGVKLTYLPFIVKAVVSGLKKWPMLNASLDETTQEIVRKKYYHVGIAAQGPQGLVVTVVRDADKRSIFDLAREIDRLGEAVRNGTATRDDLTGSTFTISSLGKLGGVMATPIINFPEVAIVGVHKIEEKPAVRNGQIVARHLMNLSISVDHRLADGWDGAMFLQDVKTLLEDPTTMFMEMI